MKCLNCKSENGEFFTVCYWKCWDCGAYSSIYIIKQKKKCNFPIDNMR